MSIINPDPTAGGRQVAGAPRTAVQQARMMFDRGEAEQHRAFMYELAGPEADWPKPAGFNVLVIQMRWPDKTAGGIWRPPASLREDRWQGNCGMVLAVGPDAYKPDGVRKFETGAWCKPGDFILFAATAMEGKRFHWRGRADIFLLPDDRIEAVVPDPVDVVAGAV
jgi:hypothetical protein